MSSLLGRSPKNSYRELLTVDNPNGLDSNLRGLCDGKGITVPLSLSNTKIALNGHIWPAADAAVNQLLRMSATTKQLEWVTLSTSDITEGTNEFFTMSKARQAYTGVGDIAVNQTTGEISFVGSSASSFDETAFWMGAA